MKLSVVIPVYNEKHTVEEIIARVLALPVDKEVLIVDDASTDGTRELLRRYEGNGNIRIFYHEKNQGKGAALQTAFGHVWGACRDRMPTSNTIKGISKLLEPIWTVARMLSTAPVFSEVRIVSFISGTMSVTVS